MPNIACMRPWLVFGWKTTWSVRNPVTAATAARTPGILLDSSDGSVPNRARASRLDGQPPRRARCADRPDPGEVEVAGLLVEAGDEFVERRRRHCPNLRWRRE